MKFEMNKETLWTLKTDADTFLTNTGMVERKYSLLGYPVSINTNKPDGIVQLGRDSIDLTYTDNIRGLLESLVYAAKRREGGAFSIPVTKEEDEAFNAMMGDSVVSLRHCQTVKDWKTQNIGGLYTPSEEDIDELIEIVLKEINDVK